MQAVHRGRPAGTPRLMGSPHTHQPPPLALLCPLPLPASTPAAVHTITIAPAAATTALATSAAVRRRTAMWEMHAVRVWLPKPTWRPLSVQQAWQQALLPIKVPDRNVGDSHQAEPPEHHQAPKLQECPPRQPPLVPSSCPSKHLVVHLLVPSTHTLALPCRLCRTRDLAEVLP
eukprot:1153297-Pelagomonas_calceolata.AAC.3